MDIQKLKRILRMRFPREEVVGIYFAVGFLACVVLVVFFGLLAREITAVAMQPGPLDRVCGRSPVRGNEFERLTDARVSSKVIDL